MPDRYGDNPDEWPQVPPPNHMPDDVYAAEVRAMAVVNCGLCNDDGMRGMHRCDHRTDHAAAAARGMAAIREILDRKGASK